MTAELPRLTSGAVGSVNFDAMNRVFDATRYVEALPEGERSQRGGRRPAMFVELIATAGAVGTYQLWSWKAIAVNSAASDVVFVDGLIRSNQYQSGQGLAIDIPGGAVAGSKVLIYEVTCFDGKRRYAIVGAAGSAGGVFALSIDSVGGSEMPYTYNVTEGRIDGTKAFIATGESGVLFNLYEFSPYGHGQDLDFATGTLTPSPLEGTVSGGLSMIDGTVRVYTCDVPNPMVPECAGVGPGGLGGPAPDAPAFSGGLTRTALDVLRYGL